MSFQSSNGNSRENLWLPHSIAKGKPHLEPIRLPGDKLSKVTFLHEWNGLFCIYTSGSVSLRKNPNFSVVKEIHYLPSGFSVQFLDHRIVMALSTGPTVVWNEQYKPLADGISIPHSGGFADVIGFFSQGSRYHIVNRMFGGGDQGFTSHIYTNTLEVKEGAPEGEGIIKESTLEIDGLFYQSLLLKDKLILTSDKGFHFAKLDGTLLRSFHPESPFIHAAVAPDDSRFGGFGNFKEQWSYLEFDPSGKLLFQSKLIGDSADGYVVFDPQGFRTVSSSKRILRLNGQGDLVWTKAVTQSATAPRHIILDDGGCAYLDGNTLMVLDPLGVERMSVPLGSHPFSSPPYLSEAGEFYLGLANEDIDLLRVVFK